MADQPDYPRPTHVSAPTGVSAPPPDDDDQHTNGSRPLTDPGRRRPWRKEHLPPPFFEGNLPPVLTAAQAAAMCDVSRKTISTWIKTGRLKRARMSTKATIWVTRQSVLDLWKPEED